MFTYASYDSCPSAVWTQLIEHGTFVIDTFRSATPSNTIVVGRRKHAKPSMSARDSSFARHAGTLGACRVIRRADWVFARQRAATFYLAVLLYPSQQTIDSGGHVTLPRGVAALRITSTTPTSHRRRTAQNVYMWSDATDARQLGSSTAEQQGRSVGKAPGSVGEGVVPLHSVLRRDDHIFLPGALINALLGKRQEHG